jgi:uncharacterized SAM-binding protein YcdF (DUF218 family)
MLTDKRQVQGSIPLPKRETEHSTEKYLWGTFMRRERWGLSWRGWSLLVAVIILSALLLLRTVYPFLAVTHRVEARILIVEGWVPEYAIRAAAKEFTAGDYKQIFTTGGPIVGSGGYTNDYQTSANVGAGRLRAAGLPSELVQMVPSHVMSRDRTYAAASALHDWFRSHHISVQGINVVTENTHARRTRLLFQEAFGKDLAIGIIAVRNPDYDETRWWQSSEGVKDILSEAVAYVYAKFFFYPALLKSMEKAEPADLNQ